MGPWETKYFQDSCEVQKRYNEVLDDERDEENAAVQVGITQNI